MAATNYIDPTQQPYQHRLAVTQRNL